MHGHVVLFGEHVCMWDTWGRIRLNTEKKTIHDINKHNLTYLSTNSSPCNIYITISIFKCSNYQIKTNLRFVLYHQINKFSHSFGHFKQFSLLQLKILISAQCCQPLKKYGSGLFTIFLQLAATSVFLPFYAGNEAKVLCDLIWSDAIYFSHRQKVKMKILVLGDFIKSISYFICNCAITNGSVLVGTKQINNLILSDRNDLFQRNLTDSFSSYLLS